MIQLDVRADVRQAQIFLRATQQGVSRATSRAINRTLITVRGEAAKKLQEKRALNISVIKKSMRIVRATARNLVGKVVVSGKPISIRHFSRLRMERMGGKVTGVSGISAKILKANRFTLLRRHGNKAFTHPKIGGGLAVVYRKTKKRLPLSGWSPVPGLPTVLVQQQIADALRTVANTAFQQRIKHELQYEINLAKRGRR